ncbi:PspC domain-containing protein [bacterium]|nr:PspC domain-containing protein [bacterium]
MVKKISEDIKSKKLYKSKKDKMIDGVCGGVAEYFGFDVTIVRVIWVMSIFAGGIGFWAYLASLLFMPKNPEQENMKSTDKVTHNQGLIWGGGLILLGLLILSDSWHFFNPLHNSRHFNYRGIGFMDFGEILPFLILACGIIYIVYTLNHKKDTTKTTKTTTTSDTDNRKKMQRSVSDRWIAGVLSGLAKYLNIEPVIVRIAYVAVSLATHAPLFLLLYIGLWVAVPESQTEEA